MIGMKPLENIRISIPEHVLSQEVENEIVLLDLKEAEYYGLDAVASRIWTLVQKHDGHPDRILETMAAEFDIGTEQLRTDLCAFLSMLEQSGLVTLLEEQHSSNHH